MTGDGVLDGSAEAADENEDAHQKDAQQEDAPAATKKKRMSWPTEIVVLVVAALAIALTVKTYIVQPFKIPSASMENTLLINDKVLVNKLVGHISQIHRGDIVVFDGAGNWDAPVASSSNPVTRIYHNVLGLFGNDQGQIDYIKRVIGLPGDRVACCTAIGLMTVNGVPLHEQAYLYPYSQPSRIRFNIVVPPGRLWVMGDNRANSDDSRLHDCHIDASSCEPWDQNGTVPESSVIGRAFMVVWPPSRFRVLWVPSDFDNIGHGGGALAAQAALPARVLPADPALPLGAGMLAAMPLALSWRRLRLRRLRRGRRPPDRSRRR